MLISEIVIPDRIRKSLGDIPALAASIKAVGLLHPVVIDENKHLIAGARRIAAYRYLGKDAVPCVMAKNLTDAAKAMRAQGEENTCRLDFAPSEAVAYKRAMTPAAVTQAKARQASAGPSSGKGKKRTGSGKLPEALKGKGETRDVVAAATGKAATTIRNAEAVVQAAEADPALLPIVERMDETGNVNAALREVKRVAAKANLESVATKKAKEADGLYDVLVIDPPWPMHKLELDCRPNQVEFDYPTMDESELTAMPIPACDDAHVWLWTTHRFLPMAFRLLEAWKLKYVCCFVWHKPNGYQPIGLPKFNAEFALYARKGSPKFLDTKAFNVCFDAPRGGHSVKPKEFYETVRRVTAGRRIDVFGREAHEGFDSSGLEAPA